MKPLIRPLPCAVVEPLPKPYDGLSQPTNVSNRWGNGTASKIKRNKVRVPVYCTTKYSVQTGNTNTGRTSKGKASEEAHENAPPNTPPQNTSSHQPQHRPVQSRPAPASGAAQGSQANELETLRRWHPLPPTRSRLTSVQKK